MYGAATGFVLTVFKSENSGALTFSVLAVISYLLQVSF